MRATIMKAAAGAAALLLTDLAVAQIAPEVQVEAKRVVGTQALERNAGLPITNIQLSYTVSARDIDISTNSGAKVLEQRVKDAAAAACKEMSRQFPNATPSDAECASNAAAKAMGQVHELVAAAEKNRTK